MTIRLSTNISSVCDEITKSLAKRMTYGGAKSQHVYVAQFATYPAHSLKSPGGIEHRLYFLNSSRIDRTVHYVFDNKIMSYRPIRKNLTQTWRETILYYNITNVRYMVQIVKDTLTTYNNF